MGHTVGHTVGEVAKLSGVTVRTLHHYDDLGLLTPSGRTASGYRQYEHQDLERLQRILGYRQLGLSLDDIGAILDDPSVDPVEHLRAQHARLGQDAARMQRQLAAIEKTMEAHRMGIALNPEEMFEVFGKDDPTRYAEEAEQRWGDTDAYRQSHERTSRYTKADWARMKAEQEQIGARLAEVMASGAAPASTEAMDAAEAHRQNITTWFYDCSYEIHRGLADMYIADPRFTANYEKLAPGLARWVHDAIHANADRAAG